MHKHPPIFPPEPSEYQLRELQKREEERRMGIDPLDRLPSAERQRLEQAAQMRALMEGYADGL